MYLEEIIENVQLESDKFECKAKLNRNEFLKLLSIWESVIPPI